MEREQQEKQEQREREEQERKERKEREEKEEQDKKERKESEERKAQEEKARWEEERQERQRQQKFQEEKEQKSEERRRGLAERLKVAGECMKNVLPQQPPETADVPLFLDTVENLFTTFKIDKDLRVKLLMPLLTNRARSIIGRMPVAELDDFEKVKKFLLTEYRITPRQIKTQFLTATKQANETYQLFASRLATLFNYYATSREVVDNYKKLCNLMVADRLKDALPTDALQYVLSLEGEGCYEPSKVASLADVFVNNCSRTPAVLGAVTRESKPYVGGEHYRHPGPVGRSSGRGRGGGFNSGAAVKKTCFNCGSEKHLQFACDRPKINGGNLRGRGGGRPQVNACSVVQPTLTSEEGAEPIAVKPPTHIAAQGATQGTTTIGRVECAFVRSVTDDDVISGGELRDRRV